MHKERSQCKAELLVDCLAYTYLICLNKTTWLALVHACSKCKSVVLTQPVNYEMLENLPVNWDLKMK